MDRRRLSLAEARRLAERALRACGAAEAPACSVAASVVAAEAEGVAGVGLLHLLDYCDALRAGRIDGTAEPVLERPTPVVFRADARGGVAHLGFDLAIDDLAAAARRFGVAVFAQRNGYTCGALGWFVARLAERGLAALAATNGGPALLAAAGTSRPVFCTNPLAFSMPRGDGAPPLVIDQSSSATAFVNIVEAARDGRAIPRGWALDAAGRPTTDPAAAMQGVLLAFGGARGANVAMIVEVLAAALTGAAWSLDAPSFRDGERSPGVGLTVVALAPAVLAGDAADRRVDAWLARIEAELGAYVPGARRAALAARAAHDGLDVPASLIARIEALVTGRADPCPGGSGGVSGRSGSTPCR